MLLLQSCPPLCDPIDGSPPGSSIRRILQARILEWVATSFFNACTYAKLLQSCPTLCDPIDGSLPGSSVHRILQARIPEWIAISFSELRYDLVPNKYHFWKYIWLIKFMTFSSRNKFWIMWKLNTQIKKEESEHLRNQFSAALGKPQEHPGPLW